MLDGDPHVVGSDTDSICSAAHVVALLVAFTEPTFVVALVATHVIAGVAHVIADVT